MEPLAWTRRTLGRVNEKNETPRRFGLFLGVVSMSPNTSMSCIGIDTVNPIDGIDLIDAKAQIDPIESVDPIDPVNAIDPIDPVDPIDIVDAIDAIDLQDP